MIVVMPFNDSSIEKIFYNLLEWSCLGLENLCSETSAASFQRADFKMFNQ